MRRVRKRSNRPLLQDPRSRRHLAAADGRALSRLCPGRRHGRVARRAARGRGRGHARRASSAHLAPARRAVRACAREQVTEPASHQHCRYPRRRPVELGARSYDDPDRPGPDRGRPARASRRSRRAPPARSSPTRTSRHHASAAADGQPRRRRHPPFRRSSVAPGEGSKSFAAFAAVCDADPRAARLERGDIVVALGGGVVGDLAGFAAATAKRGMRLRADPDEPAGAGRFLGRRQDRHQFAATARTSSAPSTSRASCWPTPLRSTPCRRASSGPAMPRSSNTG